MQRIKITLEFDVEPSQADGFHKTLLKRMHKYLAKYAATVYKVDKVTITNGG